MILFMLLPILIISRYQEARILLWVRQVDTYKYVVRINHPSLNLTFFSGWWSQVQLRFMILRHYTRLTVIKSMLSNAFGLAVDRVVPQLSMSLEQSLMFILSCKQKSSSQMEDISSQMNVRIRIFSMHYEVEVEERLVSLLTLRHLHFQGYLYQREFINDSYPHCN